MDAESAVARVCGHLVDTARRPGPGESPARPDDALRALHDVMRGALHDTPAWLRAVEQAEEGEVPARTRRRLVQAVEDAAGRDASFARQLRAALAALPPARPGGQAGAEGSVAVSGDAVVQARDGGVAALSIGDVTLHPAPRGRAENEGVVAVGGIAVGGVIAVGSNSHASHVHISHSPAPRASLPHQVGVIPPRAQAFVHRPETDRIRDALARTGGLVLTGMGGVGKTQLALDYAHEAWESGDAQLLVWAPAHTRTAVVTAYGRAGVDMCGADPGDPERAAETFLAWLGTRPCGWLVVLDDVADPADLRGLWPPGDPAGRCLATTRRRDAALHGGDRYVMSVEPFTPEESAGFVSALLRSYGRSEPPDQVAGLADDLGRLPLALAQAVAYLMDQHLAVAEYRSLLADRSRTLADATPEALPDDQTSSVAATWSLSIDHANRLAPQGLALPMLRVLALLDPNGIPASVAAADPVLGYLAAHRGPQEPDAGPPRATRLPFPDGYRGPREPGRPNRPEPEPEPPDVPRDEATRVLRLLHRLGLVDHTPDAPQQAVRVNKLLQRAVRDALGAGEREAVARAAADALAAGWPEVERDTALAAALRANAEVLSLNAQDLLVDGSGVHPVLLRLGRSLGECGQVAAAVDYFARLSGSARRLLGDRHPGTLLTLQSLVFWRAESGDLAGAVTAYEDLLAETSQVLGPDHPATLTVKSDLAWRRGQAEDFAGAATTTVEVLEDFRRVLGPDHPLTLAARHNLAWWRGRMGDAPGAAAATAELLDDFQRVLGPDHPDTFTVRRNLAQWRGEAGDAEGAAAAYEELLGRMVAVLGPDHPAVLATRHHYAWWQGQSGSAGSAAAAYGQVLEDRLRVLGPDHPDTLTTRADLAYWQALGGQTAAGRTSAGSPGAASPGPACHVRLELLDDGPARVDTAVRIALSLSVDAGHPWASSDTRRRPALEVVAVPLGRAEIEPARGLYRHDRPLEFVLRPHRAGRHVLRFTLYSHPGGAALQQVETEVTVIGSGFGGRLPVPVPLHRGGR